ncbi:hypothetical protein P3X46_006489 [Hevea brasiliensis]|uniref:Reverse transcriptase zinc-binding domain-containing protein n=1 Tax=Hevea brasiliensis TaxID=3981 RepID=A0ABQ9MU74_HEVBR|nr:uncharacterized protein LOC131179377 [Hevea brasiliensis]KAJ9182498.1 hypothetical protein P3X46_006489 [Hevea brasiliensis]
MDHDASVVWVHQLINQNSHSWNYERLQQNFHEEEIKCISAIPVGLFRQKDQLIWHYDKRGKYTVKSGYYIVREIQKSQHSLSLSVASPSSNSRLEELWKHIWKIKLPSKLSIFLWMMLMDKLPTNDTLHKRLPHFDPCCPFCGEMETSKHLFFSCPHAVAIWINSPLRLRSVFLHSVDVKDCWTELLIPLRNHEDHQQLIQLLVFILWHVWKSRNEKIFRNVIISPQDIIAATLKHFEDFSLANDSISKQSELNHSTLALTPPPVNVIKLNFDAAVDRNRRRGAIAVVARNLEGKPLDWCCKVYESIVDPLVLESLACRDAVTLALNRGFCAVRVEGDSLMVIQAILSQSAPLDIKGSSSISSF